jgi:hypothetical protein
VRVTTFWLVAAVGTAIAYAAVDVWCYARGGWTGTFSYFVLTSCRRSPLLVLALGVVLGHLLFFESPRSVGHTFLSGTKTFLADNLFVVLLIGLVLGRLLWPQPLPPDEDDPR